ncbi:MAG TPA: NosD domain-containing protein, partial [Chitinophagales bacterium]|nr:NosD domain-containing protein [Chitinophagales bacterium]
MSHATYPIDVLCCPTTFSATATTPAYLGCNQQTILGGSATLQSDATCLSTFSLANGIDHTAYGLSPGDNTISVLAAGSTHTTSVHIPTVYLDDQNIQATATVNPTDHNCTADYCSGSISVDAYLQINANQSNTNNTYAWSDCLNCNTALRTDLCEGSYTVTVTNLASACSRAFTYTVTLADAISYQNQYDEILCCIAEQPDALLPNNSTISYPDPLYPNRPALLVTGDQQWTDNDNPIAYSGELYLATDIVVAPNSSLSITGLQLYFAPHCRILVQAGGILTATNSRFDGGCQTMWQGIQAEGSTATQAPAQVFLQQCNISNAIVGLAGMNIPLVDSNNIITLNTPDANPYSNISSFALPQLWHLNSRQTAGAQLQADETLFSNCLQGINISWVGNATNKITNCTFDSEEIRYPFTHLATQTEAGIYALWVKVAGSLHHNHFSHLRYGMRLNEVNRIETHNNSFDDNLCGISSRAWLMGIDHINRFHHNQFDNNRIGLQADGIDNLLVSDNTINPNTNAQATYPNGSAGIYLRGCNSLVQNNHLYRTRFGLILADSDLDGTEIGGNIIEQTMEAIVCEGNNSSCYLSCNHLLDYTKFGLDLRAAGNTTGKLPPQGDCINQQPAANTFVPLNAIDILMGGNTADLYYSDIAANTYLVAMAPGNFTGQFIPQSSNCSSVNLVDYCEDLHLTSLADIDQMPNGITRDHELTKWFLTYLREEDYESAL